MPQLGWVVGWILTIFLGLLGAVILVKIIFDKIDLTNLINDDNNRASLSRFQFLVFTFVIALSMFYLIVSVDPPAYPKIPAEILGLLGISGGSYVISKGIQTSGDVDKEKIKHGTGDGGPATTVQTTTTTTTAPPPAQQPQPPPPPAGEQGPMA